MKFSTTFLAFAMTALSANAWTMETSSSTSNRRHFLGSVVGASAAAAAAAVLGGAAQEANAATAKTGQASPFTGFYDDPNHPDCLRQVKVVGAPQRADGSRSAFPVIEITGYDGKGDSTMCTDRPTRSDIWKLEGTVKSSTEALVDFSPKGGPTKLLAKFEDGGIVFPDGNKWVKVSGVTKDRLPEDMSTLKSE